MAKKRLFLLFLAGSTLFGCVGGSTTPHTAWPWGRDRDYDSLKTGSHIAVSRNVAQFGAAPEAAKPVAAEYAVTEKAPAARGPETAVVPAATKEPPAVEPAKGADKPLFTEFAITDSPVVPPSHLPDQAPGSFRELTAHNPGKAPVSVAIDLDPASSYNVSADQDLPVFAVVAPGAEQAVVRLAPRDKSDRFKFRYRYLSSLGDFHAQHSCSEGYRFPFPENAKASVNTFAGSGSNQYRMYFQMPKETAILPARKGVVVQIKTNKIDIMHDDGTIGTYGHVGRIGEGVVVGKKVSTDDVIGVVGGFAGEDLGYLELSVWTPKAAVDSSPTGVKTAGFDFVTYPLEFCSAGWTHCRKVKEGEVVSRNSATVRDKSRKRRTAKASAGAS